MFIKTLSGDLTVVKNLLFNMLLVKLPQIASKFTEIFSLPSVSDFIKKLPAREQNVVNGFHHLLSEDPTSVILIGSQWIDQVFEAIEEVWQRRIPTTLGKR